jgi:hypothetical protein
MQGIEVAELLVSKRKPDEITGKSEKSLFSRKPMR